MIYIYPSGEDLECWIVGWEEFPRFCYWYWNLCHLGEEVLIKFMLFFWYVLFLSPCFFSTLLSLNLYNGWHWFYLAYKKKSKHTQWFHFMHYMDGTGSNHFQQGDVGILWLVLFMMEPHPWHSVRECTMHIYQSISNRHKLFKNQRKIWHKTEPPIILHTGTKIKWLIFK